VNVEPGAAAVFRLDRGMSIETSLVAFKAFCDRGMSIEMSLVAFKALG
jgi:hypothetical protein